MFGTLCASMLAVLSPPVEVVIDCSTWTGKETTRVAVRFESWDGKVITDVFESPAGTDPSSPRSAFRIMLKDSGWRFRYLENYKVLVHGSKDWPVRRVTFKSDGWVPDYYYLPARFPQIAPPPREKK